MQAVIDEDYLGAADEDDTEHCPPTSSYPTRMTISGEVTILPPYTPPILTEYQPEKHLYRYQSGLHVSGFIPVDGSRKSPRHDKWMTRYQARILKYYSKNIRPFERKYGNLNVHLDKDGVFLPKST